MIAAKRVLVGITIAAAVLGVFLLEFETGTTWGTTALLVLLVCSALHELFRMFAGAGFPSYSRFAVVSSGVLLALRGAAAPLGLDPYEARELFLGGLGCAAVAPLLFPLSRKGAGTEPTPGDLRPALVTAFGLLYVAFLGSFLMEIRLLGPGDRGLKLVVLLVASVKTADSCAYFVGRTIGRTPLCWASPKKTWEGSAASVVGAVAVCYLVGHVLWDFDWRVMVVLAVISDFAGQAGDLAESYLKRALGVKDSGTTFGEIGGALDMLDALLPAAPIAYLWIQLILVRGV